LGLAETAILGCCVPFFFLEVIAEQFLSPFSFAVVHKGQD
jgi:hypothetical protein